MNYCFKINLSEKELNKLREIIHNSGFQWFDYKYGGITVPGWWTIIIAIPEYHKRVESSSGNAPEGFKKIYTYIYEDLLDVY